MWLSAALLAFAFPSSRSIRPSSCPVSVPSRSNQHRSGYGTIDLAAQMPLNPVSALHPHHIFRAHTPTQTNTPKQMTKKGGLVASLSGHDGLIVTGDLRGHHQELKSVGGKPITLPGGDNAYLFCRHAQARQVCNSVTSRGRQPFILKPPTPTPTRHTHPSSTTSSTAVGCLACPSRPSTRRCRPTTRSFSSQAPRSSSRRSSTPPTRSWCRATRGTTGTHSTPWGAAGTIACTASSSPGAGGRQRQVELEGWETRQGGGTICNFT